MLGADAAAIIVLRPEAFWDKQRVDNCARTQKEGEVRSNCAGGVRGGGDGRKMPHDGDSNRGLSDGG